MKRNFVWPLQLYITPGLGAGRVFAVTLQLLQVARVPFVTRGAEMTEVGRTAEA